ncbi:MAG: ABC transporter ATP-binding protein [Wenzhouxiangella sp.]|nr:ABC transporter ATP-binding protein [Wenzhouxiangella sp.]TVR92310.1 MAG: ABC transporter ATP-binding protein [Wenzhouxiangellaceae bacterium]
MNEQATALIQLSKLSRIFTTDTLETHAIAGIDLEIGRGEYVSIEGPSGCGKSTLLHLLGLLDEPSGGEYRLAGVPITEIDAEERARLRNREIGFVFQSFNLIPEMTVAENVALPLVYRPGLKAGEITDRARAALARVNMTERADHRPAQLSGGQQQRVAIARALVGEPSLVLADEPTGNLDQANGDQVMGLLEELHAGGTTIVMVTHNPAYSQRAARRLNMLDGSLA